MASHELSRRTSETSRGVTIRNILKTHVLQWEQIERFELPRQDPRKRVAVAVLKDGASVAMSGIRYSGLESRSAQRIVDELNAQLTERGVAMQVNGPSANTLPELESLVELLMEPVGREARQRLLRNLRLVP
jgi:Bacterial PH domain